MNLLAIHTLKTLPDSLAERRALLNEIIRFTKAGTGVRQTAALMLRHMDEGERAQAEFIFTINQKDTQ